MVCAPMSSTVLSSADLLCLILAGPMAESCAWCCAHRGASQHHGKAMVRTMVIRKCLSLRLVSKAFFDAIAVLLQEPLPLLCDLRGVCISARSVLHIADARELILDHVPSSSFGLHGVTALCLNGCDAADLELAELLKALPGLRALSIAHCRGASVQCLDALSSRSAKSLSALDLGGCPRLVCQTSAMRLDAFFRRATQLRRLNLSGQPSLGSAIVGSVLLTLCGTLTCLLLDACSLTAEDLCLSPDVSSDRPTTATRLWKRLVRLQTLGLADNPRLSARACCAVLDSVPTLTALDVSASDFWLDELPHFICALQAAPALRWAGCDDGCSWLDPSVLRQLQSIPGLQVAAPSELVLAAARASGCIDDCGSSAHTALVPVAPPTETPLDSWEDIGDALLGASGEESAGGPSRSSSAAAFALPPALSLPSDSHTSPAAAPPDLRAPFRLVDYSRPERYRQQRLRSIYHISQGDQPYYAEGSAAAVTSQTDAHGLRC